MIKDFAMVTQLQGELVRSFDAGALAVRRVLGNVDAKTPGVDNLIWDCTEKIKRHWESSKTSNSINLTQLSLSIFQKQVAVNDL